MPIVIFDTDMGPDIDDALALAMLHAYEKKGQAEIAAVTLSRNSVPGARYIDLVNTFYGRPDIPIGKYLGSTPHDRNEYHFTGDIVAGGNYPHDVHLEAIPEGYKVMRQVLADSPPNSVTIVQVGFSTNTEALLQSGPDEFSPLNGIDLVREKAKLLSVMGGRNGSAYVEFNISQHVPSALTVFEEWPIEILQSDGNLGQEILYPLSSILKDFDYVDRHPIKESYLNKDFSWHDDEGEYYNMRSWDLTSVLAAVEEPANYFAVTAAGTVNMSSDGHTSFAESSDGLHRSLGRYWELTPEQHDSIINRLVTLVPEAP